MVWGWGDSLGMIEAHHIHCALRFYSSFPSSTSVTKRKLSGWSASGTTSVRTSRGFGGACFFSRLLGSLLGTYVPPCPLQHTCGWRWRDPSRPPGWPRGALTRSSCWSRRSPRGPCTHVSLWAAISVPTSAPRPIPLNIMLGSRIFSHQKQAPETWHLSHLSFLWIRDGGNRSVLSGYWLSSSRFPKEVRGKDCSGF